MKKVVPIHLNVLDHVLVRNESLAMSLTARWMQMKEREQTEEVRQHTVGGVPDSKQVGGYFLISGRGGKRGLSIVHCNKK